MGRRFPREAIGLIRCPLHGSELAMASDDWVDCRAHAHGYRIDDGVLKLLDTSALPAESARELQIRDLDAARADDDRAVETELTVGALAPLGGKLLELGCGNGHFTNRLRAAFTTLVAVDFSEQSLRMVEDAPNVALVQADVCSLKVAPGAFDRVLSTLTSNLPSAADRAAMYEVGLDAVGAHGHMVFSAHHHNLFGSVPKSGHYGGDGIYRYRFSRGELEREAGRFFSRVEIRAMEVWCRGAGRLRKLFGEHVADDVLGRIPGLNAWAQLLLGQARA
jgi:SAM-dependent methyltransferase